MRKLSRISFFMVFLTTVAACHKDKPNPLVSKQSDAVTSTCHNYVYIGSEVLQNEITTGDQYIRPCFNPNNGDEFVYVKTNYAYSSQLRQLIKHTISTGLEQVLCDGISISGQPQWGKQGWILFAVGTQPPLVIWKIYEDGSGLAQVTPGNLNCFNPTFNEIGDNFIIMGVGLEGGYRPIFDLIGNIVDSILFTFNGVVTGYPYSNGDLKNGVYAYSDHNTNPQGMGFCQLINNTSIERLNTINLTPNGGGLVHSMCQNNQSIFYTQYQLGLYRLDKTTHQTSLVMENCQSNYINSLSMSPDGQFLLYERINGHQTSPGSWDIDLQSEIFLYNIATGQQTKLLGEE